MPLTRFRTLIQTELAAMAEAGMTKAQEPVVRKVIAPRGGRGARFQLEGYGETEFLRMNSNNYLGMSLRPAVIAAEEHAVREYGVGPGAVRFISGTYQPHVDLETRLARFHQREACMLTSAAYTSIMGVLVTLTTPETVIISDELNHNCIINGMRLARPKDKQVYRHLDVVDLERNITEAIGHCQNLLIITDGVFSMRGAYAPLDRIAEVVRRYDDQFERGIVLIVDDSHGVGALGRTGRGTEEHTGAVGVDILVATIGKALGVNGGYLVTSKEIVTYLREKNPFYIFTNPITPPEAAAALAAIDILDSPEGVALLGHLHAMTDRFEQGLIKLGYETIESDHPVVPLFLRDTAKTNAMVSFLRHHKILATGLNFPVVPRGEQLVRFQVSADHTPADIDYVLGILKDFRTQMST